jgi:hypothetical protein
MTKLPDDKDQPVVPVGVRERVLDELDKAWLHGQRRTSWRRDESADAIMAALRPTDTGEDTAGSPISQNTEPGLPFSDAGEL